MDAPKLFISYQSSNLRHNNLVLRIATGLREAGVDVIFDKWDLKPSDDFEKFFENSLAEAGKVLVIADKIYAEKALEETGAGGRIINREIYQKKGAEKFALVVAQKNADGEAFVPEWIDSDVWIDFSEEFLYASEFDKLLRWCFDKPPLTKPLLGEKPSFLENDSEITLGTREAFRKALEAVKEDRSNARGRVDEYLSLFTKNLERLRITEAVGEMDETVLKSIESFKPIRDEYLQLLVALAGYNPDIEYASRIHRFIEELIFYTNPAQHIKKRLHWDLDNYMFISHEIFLYTLAVFLKFERFEEAGHLLSTKYLIPGESRYGRDEMISFDNFHRHLESLEKLHERLETGTEAPRAELLRDRCRGSGVEFRHLMQADFTAFLKAELHYLPYYSQWYPETLAFLESSHGALEIYVRARSKSYFNRLKKVLGIEIVGDFNSLINAYERDRRQLPRGMKETTAARLIGFKALATQP